MYRNLKPAQITLSPLWGEFYLNLSEPMLLVLLCQVAIKTKDNLEIDHSRGTRDYARMMAIYRVGYAVGNGQRVSH